MRASRLRSKVTPLAHTSWPSTGASTRVPRRHRLVGGGAERRGQRGTGGGVRTAEQVVERHLGRQQPLGPVGDLAAREPDRPVGQRDPEQGAHDGAPATVTVRMLV